MPRRPALLFSLAALAVPLPLAAQEVAPRSFVAAAVSDAHTQVWMVADAPSEAEAAARARALCEQDTGTPCQLAFAAQRRYLVAARSPLGSFKFLAGDAPEGLAGEIRPECVEEFSAPCEFVAMVGPGAMQAYPATRSPAEPRRYAALAGDFASWPTSNTPDFRVWGVTGSASRGEAERDALAACAAAIGTARCQVRGASGDLHVLLYRGRGPAYGGFLSELTPDRAVQELDRLCAADGETCAVLGIYAIARPAQFSANLSAR